MCKCYENNVISLNTAKNDPIQGCIRVKFEYFQSLYPVSKKKLICWKTATKMSAQLQPTYPSPKPAFCPK